MDTSAIKLPHFCVGLCSLVTLAGVQLTTVSTVTHATNVHKMHTLNRNHTRKERINWRQLRAHNNRISSAQRFKWLPHDVHIDVHNTVQCSKLFSIKTLELQDDSRWPETLYRKSCIKYNMCIKNLHENGVPTGCQHVYISPTGTDTWHDLDLPGWGSGRVSWA